MFCTRLANGGLFPTGDPIVPFVISPRFECLNKLTHTEYHLQICAGYLHHDDIIMSRDVTLNVHFLKPTVYLQKYKSD